MPLATEECEQKSNYRSFIRKPTNDPGALIRAGEGSLFLFGMTNSNIVHGLIIKMATEISQESRESGRLAAFSIALRQLIEAHQEKAAERLINQCSRAFSRRLLEYPVVAWHARSSYVVRTRLRRKIDALPEELAQDTLKPLVSVLNAWCQEGRRSAVRSVVREMNYVDLGELSSKPGLDPEVATIMVEFLD